ncbi:MAG: hypothetical protein K6C94_03620 [Candidatus Gastranaerophilales bacterium]|nr:hypothetical protein [Candidatus Gastranaerophilales bacterium]
MKKEILIKSLIVAVILVIIFILTNLVICIYISAKYQRSIAENIGNVFKREPCSIEKYINLKDEEILSGKNYKKPGVLLFGCGFAKGLNLEPEQKFSFKLSKLTQRPVYNYGIGGAYIQHAIKLVQSGLIDNEIKKCDYAIYMISAIKGDAPRLEVYPGEYSDINFLLNPQMYPVLKVSKDNILEEPEFKNHIITDSYVARLFNKFYVENLKKDIKNPEKTYLHVLKLQEELKKKNPKIKLMLFLYWSEEGEFEKYAKLLKKNDISVFSLPKATDKDIKEDKYKEPKYSHPSEEAWNEFTPLFVKEMKL